MNTEDIVMLFTVGTSITAIMDQAKIYKYQDGKKTINKETVESLSREINKLVGSLDNGEGDNSVVEKIKELINEDDRKIGIEKVFEYLWGEDGQDKDNTIKSNFNNISLPTAEFNSSYKWLAATAEKKTPDSLKPVFFSTDNPASILTANVARALWAGVRRRKLFTDIDILPGTNSQCKIEIKNEDKFRKSVDSLFKKLDEKRVEAEQDHKTVIINATGGYKPIAGFAAIYAQIFDLSTIYLYEGSKEAAVELPTLPLGYAIESLEEEISLLRAIKDNPDIINYPSDCLPPWVNSLVYKTAESGGQVLGFLAKSLIKQYKTRREREAIGKGLLYFLKECDLDGRLSEYVRKRISGEWANLWIGDQIPETVEHSRRHSRRLMEIGANLLRALGEKGRQEAGLDDPFTLALLISAIYLHDIGHTAFSFPINKPGSPPGPFPLGLFPSAVREVHHLLTGNILENNPKKFFPGKDGIENEVSLLKLLTPLVCAYHRKYTRLKSPEGTLEQFSIDIRKNKPAIWSVSCFLFGEEKFKDGLRSLEKSLKELADKNMIELEYLQKTLSAAALLRVIDACDVQADRVVSSEYLKARLDRTRDEARSLMVQLETFPEKEETSEIRKLVEKVDQAGELFKTDRAVKGQLDSNAVAKINEVLKKDSFYKKIFKCLSDLKEDSAGFKGLTAKPLVRELSLCNRVVFKWEQFLHFYKHRLVGYVFPLSDREGEISIKVVPQDKKLNNSGDINDIRIEIQEEIEACGEVLPFKITVEDIQEKNS